MLSTLRRRGSTVLWRLRRRPLLWWALALAAASLTFLTAQRTLAEAEGRCPSGAAAAATSTSAASSGSASSADGGALARSVPSGSRAVAVPAPGLLEVEVGDTVDLVAPQVPLVEGAALEGDADGGAQVLAGAALVVAVSDTSVTVAVDEADAPGVALAAAAGGTTLTLLGRGAGGG